MKRFVPAPAPIGDNLPVGERPIEDLAPAQVIDRLHDVRKEKNRLEKLDKLLTDKVKARGLGTHYGNKHTATVLGREREQFETARFRAEHPKLAAQYTKDNPYTVVEFG